MISLKSLKGGYIGDDIGSRSLGNGSYVHIYIYNHGILSLNMLQHLIINIPSWETL